MIKTREEIETKAAEWRSSGLYRQRSPRIGTPMWVAVTLRGKVQALDWALEHNPTYGEVQAKIDQTVRDRERVKDRHRLTGFIDGLVWVRGPVGGA
jgi:hypothetical protein